MIYSHQYKFVYFSTPKTASSSIWDVLARDYGGEMLYDRHDNRVPEEMKDYFKFATIRHPYARAISAFKHLYKAHDTRLPPSEYHKKFHMISMTTYMQKELKVEEWVNNNMLWNDCITGNPGPGLGIHFLHVENLEEEFAALPFVGKKIKLPFNNRSIIEITPEMEAMARTYVKENYPEDFVNFGYQL